MRGASYAILLGSARLADRAEDMGAIALAAKLPERAAREMGDTCTDERAVSVIAGDGTLSGAVQAVPCSSQPQPGHRWACRLATAIDGVGPSWAVCDKFGTVAVSSSMVDASHAGPRRPTRDAFTAVLGLVLPRLRAAAALELVAG